MLDALPVAKLSIETVNYVEYSHLYISHSVIYHTTAWQGSKTNFCKVSRKRELGKDGIFSAMQFNG